jgi:hypothetical protein
MLNAVVCVGRGQSVDGGGSHCQSHSINPPNRCLRW